ncbi:hypothetical protein EES44_24595 [Streptomyces sp. ADI96-15]|uniref:hypothetical protein n=1 Tax=Streptomyces sp. ADI96-15 TaxID=1522761 RepID=UPI000F5549DD|nr:hypothetical protein [Streptomyces sp. ADI96-15]RPK58115.1 hypothetical protein EES44_24595 [Streptomyces sp. ADI96-15]
MSTPGQRPDTSGGIARTPLDIGETHDCRPFPTSADTVRTRPDGDGPDSDPGVRFAYRATVPRGLAAAALAEAFAHLGAALHPPEPAKAAVCCECREEPSVYENYKGDLFCRWCANGERPPGDRRAQVAAAIADAFDLPAILRKGPRR